MAKKLSNKEFLGSLEALTSALRQQIEAECDGFAPDPAASTERRRQAVADFAFFRATYFPHYVRAPGASVLHTWLDTELPAVLACPDDQRIAVAAPRGEAKSTIVALMFVLWTILTGRKRYVVLLADALDQAVILLEAIKAELEVNPRLALDFADGCGQGRVWNAGVVVTANNAKIEAFGAGKRIRGRRHGPYRPDLAIGDDLENDENVKSPEQRDKLMAWLTKSVLSLGGVGSKLDVIVIGTILHYDSVLARLLKNPLWRGEKFRSVLRWPDRMDLWDQWEEILLTQGVSSDDAQAAAQVFYTRQQAEMEAGASVSWPQARPLYSLMLKRARDGHSAFDSEQQNDPLSSDDAPFAKCITFWVSRLADWLYFAAADPSLGKHGQGRDPSALLVGGYDRGTGRLDVVEASIRRRLPDRIIEDIIALQAEYNCLAWAVEAVQFQAFLLSELLKRGAARGIHVPARAVIPSTDKALRIESLQPYMSAGLIRLHPSQHTLIEQLRHWPLADHDDGPDALHMLWELAVKGFVTLQEGDFIRVGRGGSRNLRGRSGGSGQGGYPDIADWEE